MRLDQWLVENGLCESREKAQRLILAGEVRLNGHRADKASIAVKPEATVEVQAQERYVSRGGYKLEAALATFHISAAGKYCLDVGSSTGGFTDCLLQHGAAHVTALDVGHGQLHWKLRQDPRVQVREGINARLLKSDELSHVYAIAVLDLSFISLKLVLPAIFPFVQADGHIISLIKPQFEVGKDQVGATTVDVEVDAQDLLGHRRALDVPAGATVAPR